MLVSTLKDWKRGEKETRERLGLLAIGKRKRDVEDSDDEEEIEHKRAKHERNTEVENFFDKLEIRKDRWVVIRGYT